MESCVPFLFFRLFNIPTYQVKSRGFAIQSRIQMFFRILLAMRNVDTMDTISDVSGKSLTRIVGSEQAVSRVGKPESLNQFGGWIWRQLRLQGSTVTESVFWPDTSVKIRSVLKRRYLVLFSYHIFLDF
jgi:hypothetical protein